MPDTNIQQSSMSSRGVTERIDYCCMCVYLFENLTKHHIKNTVFHHEGIAHRVCAYTSSNEPAKAVILRYTISSRLLLLL